MTLEPARYCPQCLIDGKGQVELQRSEVWGNAPDNVMSLEAMKSTGGFSSNGAVFHEVHYTCGNCGGVFYDTE